MSKLPVRRISSDDFSLTESGETYHPHAGEWIEVIGRFKVGDLRAFDQIKAVGVQVESLRDDAEPAARLELIAAMSEHFAVLCSGLANRLVGWNWTDDRGQPLPCPAGHPEVLEQLTADEIYWLIAAVQSGVNASDRGKD